MQEDTKKTTSSEATTVFQTPKVDMQADKTCVKPLVQTYAGRRQHQGARQHTTEAATQHRQSRKTRKGENNKKTPKTTTTNHATTTAAF